jgi:hypothetical protein
MPTIFGRRDDERGTTVTRGIRRAATVIGLGLAVQLVAALHWTPATFILSAAVGAPLVLAGGVMFLAAVWRNMKDKGAV